MLQVVQYLPCGHTDMADVEDTRGPEFVDAPTRPSRECSTCQDEQARQDRLNAEFLSDFDEDF